MSAADIDVLTERLEHSRAALLEALTERTEADFAQPLGGAHGDDTLGYALAALAQAERADLAIARSQEPAQRELPDKPLPPQVTHDLAGARHQTLVALESLDASAAQTFVEAVTARETALADEINAILRAPAKRTIDIPVVDRRPSP